MKRALLAGVGVLLAAAPAEAQLWGFPDYATPSAMGTPSTFIAATYGRGLDDDSGQIDAYGAVVGRTGLGERITVVGGLALIDDVVRRWTFGGSVGRDLLEPDSPTQVSIQGGIGYLSVDVLGSTLTSIRFPIGFAFKGRVEGPSANVTPWVMPRVNVTRASIGGNSNTEADFGASAGVGVTMPAGVGFHAALDLLLANDTLWHFGAGLHYLIP